MTERVHKDATPGSRAPALAGAALFVLVASASLWLFVLRHYFIKAYSDPINWLIFAQNLPTQFGQNRWAVGYALFLRSVLRLAGPYYVFLSNLPLLNLLFLMIGVLTAYAVRANEKPVHAILMGAAAFAFTAGFEPGLVLQMTSPYRDPLSLVFLFTSTALLIRYVQDPQHRMFALAFSGLFLGSAYSVREPSLLMGLPFTIFALTAWSQDRTIPFWRSAITFAVAVLIGILPIVAQSLAATGQAILPPQATGSGTGLHTTAEIFGRTGRQAIEYFRENALLLVIAAPLGVVYAMAHRNRPIFWLLLPALIIYAVFYSFYYVFVRRYFYIVSLLLVPFAVAGIFGTADLVLRALRRTHYKTAVYVLLALASLLFQTTRLLGAKPAGPLFQLAEARQFARDLGAVLPPDAIALCRRNLCEMIRYFTRIRSFPLSTLAPPEGDVMEPVRRNVDRLFEAGPVFVVEIPSHRGRDDDTVLARRLYDLTPVRAFPTARYHIEELLSASTFTAYRVSHWTNTAVSTPIPPTPAGSVLRVDARDLWREGDPRSFARLYLDGRLLDSRVRNGANYYFLRRRRAEGMLTLKSDQAVPADLSPTIGLWIEPIAMDFSLSAEPSHAALLSDGFTPADRVHPSPRMRGQGVVTLPVLGAPGDRVLAEFLIRSPVRKADTVMPVEFRADGRRLGVFNLPMDRQFHSATIPMPPGSSSPNKRVQIALDAGAGDIDLDQIVLYRIVPAQRRVIDIGAEGDQVLLGGGFHNRETSPPSATVRWTTAKASVTAYLDPRAGALSLNLYRRDQRPAGAPPVELSGRFNGHALTIATEDAGGGATLHRAQIPADWVAESNRIELSCAPWRPADFGVAADPRELGIMLDRIELQPVEVPRR